MVEEKKDPGRRLAWAKVIIPSLVSVASIVANVATRK